MSRVVMAFFLIMFNPCPAFAVPPENTETAPLPSTSNKLPLPEAGIPTPAKPMPAEIQTSRGQLLYENHCLECHTSVVHIRNNRKAVTLTEVRNFVIRWSHELRLPWQEEEIDDVVRYLDQQYYKLEPR